MLGTKYITNNINQYLQWKYYSVKANFLISTHAQEKNLRLFTFFIFYFAAIKEERFRFGPGYDQVEDVIGVAQPVRFNSKHLTFVSCI